jgi:sugar phosphate isomerase/epimerase
MPFRITAFADEIASDLDTQLRVMKEHEVVGLDLRSVDGKNVLTLSDAEIDTVREKVREAGLEVQCVGSPVNKVPLEGDREAEEGKKLDRAIEVAHRLGIRRIRIFTPESNDGEAVMDWMRKQHATAQAADVLLLVENDAKYWSAYPDNAKTLFRELAGPNLMAAFDFANAQLLGYPVEHWFPWIVPYLDTIHIKDAKDGKVVPAGQGDAGIEITLKSLWKDGWSGPLTLEPHLAAAGAYGGFSGEKLFAEAANALKSVLAGLDA